MGGPHQHRQFFRFRSPAGVVTSGDIKPLCWLFPGLSNIDYNYEVLIEEVMYINQHFPGFSYSELKAMDFSLYEKIIRKIKEITRKDSPEGIE